MKWFCILLIGMFQASIPGAVEHNWHTTPDAWKEPRLFHTPFDSTYNDRIEIRRILSEMIFGEKYTSPNGAYSFVIQSPDMKESGPWDTIVHVYNEKEDLIQIVIKDHAQYDITVRWINEKLLFIRIWWGRVLGTDMIFDVEQESAILKEMVNDGVIPFQQWKEKDNSNNSDIEH